MILLVTNSADATADYFASYLSSAEEPYIRFDTDFFISSYSIEFSDIDGRKFFSISDREKNQSASSASIKGVWYRRPVRPIVKLQDADLDLVQELSTEARAQYETVIRSLSNSVWVSFPEYLRFAEDRLVQLDYARKCGFSSPHTMITNDRETARLFVKSHKKVCFKPFLLGQIPLEEGVGLLYTSIVEQSDEKFFEKVPNFPVLLQEYINKKVELRITVVGNDIFAVKIILGEDQEAKIDWRIDNSSRVTFEPITLNPCICSKLLQLVHMFGLNFASMDVVISDEDKYYFLDLNPNGQWAWLDQSLGLGIAKSLGRLLSGGE